MRDKYLLKKYGITEEQYDELHRKQRGCCAVCGRPSAKWKARLSVDHDHKTGDIRGLLCAYCNRWIVGRHRREAGAELLLRAYTYLLAEYPGWIVPPKRKKKKRGRKKKTKRLLPK